MPRTTWIDFKAVKERVAFGPVLARYGLELRQKGSELAGRCPFHDDEKASFSINVEKRVFHCFGCGAKGNVLDFVARKEATTVRRAAELLAEWFSLADVAIASPRASQRPRERPTETDTPAIAKAKQPAPAGDDALKPLSFQLKLDPEHPYLASRGITRELAEFFGIGFCARGLMKDRIAIPLHNEGGELVGYVGRWPSDDPPANEERYKLPPGFRKSEILFNLHRAASAAEIVLVEGCWSVFRLHWLGIASVALLGRTLSPRQEALLRATQASRFTLLLDGDSPGREAAAELLPRLARTGFVRVVELPEGAQPDTVSEDALRGLLKIAGDRSG